MEQSSSLTFESLRQTAYNLHADERLLVQGEHKLYLLKLALAEAQDALGREISLASLAAYEEGMIDGKNESIRKCQLDKMLAEHPGVGARREQVRALESEIGKAELNLGYLRAQTRYRRNVFEAALAIARTQGAETVRIVSELDESARKAA